MARYCNFTTERLSALLDSARLLLSIASFKLISASSLVVAALHCSQSALESLRCPHSAVMLYLFNADPESLFKLLGIFVHYRVVLQQRLKGFLDLSVCVVSIRFMCITTVLRPVDS